MASPCGLLLGVADARDLSHPPHYHPQPVVSYKDLHSTAHGDALQADPIHLHQLITHKQASLCCTHHMEQASKQTSQVDGCTTTGKYTHTHIVLTCRAVILHFADKYAESMFRPPTDTESQTPIWTPLYRHCVNISTVIPS